MTKQKKGILLAFLTSIISGIAIFYSKISVAKIDPLVLTTSRNLYVGILFILLFFVRKRWGEINKLKRREILILILIGLVGGWLPFYLFFTGLTLTQAITANLIHKTLFVWVTILAVVILREKLNRAYIISFFLVIIANFYFAKLDLVFGKGEIMILTATLFWSVENILAKKVLKSVSSEIVGLFRMGIGSILLLTTSLLSGKVSAFAFTDLNKLFVVLMGGTILFFYVFTWYKALKYAPASLATLILTFSIVVGNILNGAFSTVKILPKDIYSSVFIAGATIIILLQPYVIPHLMRNLLNRFPRTRE